MTDFHDLYKKYAGDIYRFAFYLCGDAAEAEDITAETFARVILGKVPLRPVTVKGYLLRIARNLFLESVRRRKRFTQLPANLIDKSPNLENVINHKDELDNLYAYLQHFAEVDRTALQLKSDGLSYDEISKILDISLTSAKVKVHRLRKKLIEWRIKRNKPE